MPDIDKQTAELYMTLKPTPDTNLDRAEANVTMFTGRVSYKGEKTIVQGRNHTLDLPTKESFARRFIASGGGNRLAQLQQSLENLEGGPWSASGRDGNLTIKNRNYNQKPLAAFTYFGGHGELLSFSAKTTRTEKTLDTSSSSEIDPDEKSVINTEAQGTSEETSNQGTPTTSTKAPEFENVGGRLYFRPPSESSTTEEDFNNWKNAPKQQKNKPRVIKAHTPATLKALKKGVEDNFTPTDAQVDEYMSELRSKYGDLTTRMKNGDMDAVMEMLSKQTLPKFTVKRKAWVIKWVQPYELSDYNMYPEGRAHTGSAGGRQSGGANRDLHWRWMEGYSHLSKGKLPNMKLIPKAQAVKWNGKGRKPEYTVYDQVQVASYEEVEVPIDGTRIITSARPPSATNSIVKSIQEEITGTMRIVGHPEIESEKLLQINNISNKYSGEWYITNIKHRIDSAGYHCDAQLIKKGSTIITNTVVSSSNLNAAYARLHKIAEATAARKSAGISIETQFLKAVDQIVREEKEKGRHNPEASYDLVLDDKAVEKWATYNPKKDKPIELPIYPAKQDVINIDKTRAALKEEVAKSKEPKK